MSSLPYLALPYENESPRSILIRTAKNNGFLSVSMLANRLSAKPTYSLEENLLGKSELSQKLIHYKTIHTARIESAFYKKKPGPTSNSPVIINQTEIPHKLIRTRGHHICPDCVSEKGYFKNILDLNVIDVCNIHKRYLLSACVECNTELKWIYSEKHSSCECEQPVKQTDTVSETTGAQYIQEALNSQDHDFFRKLPEVLKALRHQDKTSREDRNKILNEAVNILTNPKKYLKANLQKAQSEHPGMPIAVLAAPFSTSEHMDKSISEACRHVIAEYSPDYPSECDYCMCSTKFLTITETSRALNLTSITLKSIANYLPRTDYRIGTKYSYKDICSFLRTFAVTDESELPLYETERLTFTSPGKSLKDKIQGISDGELKVLKSDQRKGLSGVIVPAFIANTKFTNEDVKDLLTVSEVAVYLNVYKDAIRSISKTEYLSPVLYKGTQPFFDIADVEEFHNRYMFISPLAKSFGKPSNVMAQGLKIAGIEPISALSINNNYTYLYLRSDLEEKLGERLNAIEQKIIIGGRRSKTKLLKPQTNPHSISAKEVASELNVSIRYLTKIEAYGLLKRIPVEGESGPIKKHYSITSYRHAKNWIESAKSIDKFATESKVNKALFMRRFITNKYVSPLFLTRNVGLLSIDDQNKIRRHLSKYCTCSEADSYHQAPAKHFQNLLKRGKISKVGTHELPEGYSCDITLLKWSDVKKYRY